MLDNINEKTMGQEYLENGHYILDRRKQHKSGCWTGRSEREGVEREHWEDGGRGHRVKSRPRVKLWEWSLEDEEAKEPDGQWLDVP